MIWINQEIIPKRQKVSLVSHFHPSTRYIRLYPVVVVRSAILTCLISALIIAVNTSTVRVQNSTGVDKTQLQMNKNFANKLFKSNHLLYESLETVEVEGHFPEQREILIMNWIFHKMMSYIECL